MKPLLPISVLAFLEFVSCSSAPPAPSAQAIAPTRPEPQQLKIPYSVVGSYTKIERNCKLVVVKGPLSDSDLIALAKDLHRTFRNESVAYKNWARNYPDSAYPYPEEWVQKHHIGMINKMLAPGGATWQLLGGTAHPTSPESKIVDLE